MSGLRDIASRLRRLMVRHDGRDNSAYWRGRASSAGSAAVLWTNDSYNQLVKAARNYKAQEVQGGLGTGGRLGVQGGTTPASREVKSR